MVGDGGGKHSLKILQKTVGAGPACRVLELGEIVFAITEDYKHKESCTSIGRSVF